MTPESLTAALKQEAMRLGFELTGAVPAATPPGIGRFEQWLADGYAGEMHYLGDRADAYRHPGHVLDGAEAILMLGSGYRTVEPADTGPGQGRVSRYAWGTDYHELIRQRLHRLADFHRQLVPGVAVRGVVDTAPLLEREFAQLAGLGWIGKNTMLIHRRYGSWILLAALLTSEPLAYDWPCEVDRCGTCRACLDACPTGALVEPRRLDARRCISYLTVELRESISAELREPLGDRLFGCDACQEVCPWNRRAPSSVQRGLRPEAGMNPVGLAELFSLDEAAFGERLRHTPLWRAKRQGILRNAAIVLGNRPHAAALGALIDGLQDAEPLVRGACAWALGRYAGRCGGRIPGEALRQRLAIETDRQMRDEIVDALGNLVGGNLSAPEMARADKPPMPRDLSNEV
ncbi:MAG: tRNA epoxyqueuosine(34) reductase QueG [Planctomycetes bacterium RBG_13_63_9]|nr:MAG: tRNA epoxyqueuosine(34) reductase QueG [Planctomycetes bacterium RBG_13_63_9]